ncbi:MAG: single-stranded DNA-binding protein [Terrisporobacter sp.]|uniref:single-stranded DNA-binding protein n=1 Tax=Terrisporobacter sp. TaxID=1965305 RepID=UPI002FC7AC4F
MNKIILTGRLCHNPEIKYVGEKNTPITKFTIAVSREYKNSQGQYGADFIDCELWGKHAEIFCQYMEKGKLFGVEGQLRLEKYVSSSGENVKKIIVRCSKFDFLTSKTESNNNIKSADAIFDNEAIFEGEISESEIPF